MDTTSTTQDTAIPAPLTDEQIASIEANNKLLKVFSAYMVDLEAANPTQEFPGQLLYSVFLLGASAVSKANANVYTQVHNDIQEMHALMVSILKENSDETE